MKWRDIALTIAVLLILAPFIQAQTQPVGTQGSVSGGIGRFADGTAAAPSIAFINETTTGLYRQGTNALSITIGSTENVRFSASDVALITNTSALRFGSSADVGFTRAAAASMTATNGGTGKAAFSTAGTLLGLAIPAGAIGFATASTATVGNTGQGGRFVLVCGPTAGTGSLLFYAGTTNTPVVLANAVGGGLIGC